MLWSYAVIICFVYLLALSLLNNRTVFGNNSMNNYFVYEFAYTPVIVPVICIALGRLAVKFYDALSDTVKNQYGGLNALGLHIKSFYYRFVYIPLKKLPVLNAAFVVIGGFLSVCSNNVFEEE